MTPCVQRDLQNEGMRESTVGLEGSVLVSWPPTSTVLLFPRCLFQWLRFSSETPSESPVVEVLFWRHGSLRVGSPCRRLSGYDSLFLSLYDYLFDKESSLWPSYKSWVLLKGNIISPTYSLCRDSSPSSRVANLVLITSTVQTVNLPTRWDPFDELVGTEPKE